MTFRRRANPETRAVIKRCVRALADARRELKGAGAGIGSVDDAQFRIVIAGLVGNAGSHWYRPQRSC